MQRGKEYPFRPDNDLLAVGLGNLVVAELKAQLRQWNKETGHKVKADLVARLAECIRSRTAAGIG